MTERMTETDTAVDDLTFEQALAELRDIVGRLEQGDARLDESLALYERGAKLKAVCEKRLTEAKGRIDQITMKADGSVSAEQLDLG